MALSRICTSILLAAVAVTVGCNRGQQAGPQGPGALPVKVQTVKLQSVNDTTEFVATIKSRNAAIIQPQVEGHVTRIFVKSGDRVQAGQKLLQIDPEKQQAAVRTQEATERSRASQLDLAKLQLDRVKKLYSEGVISRQELDQAQTAYNSALADVQALHASVAEQQQQLRYFTVTAPRAGVVGDIPVRVGDRVATQTVLTTVDAGGDLEAYISIPAERSGDVKTGTPVELILEDGTAVPSKITFISPSIDPQNQLLLTKAQVPAGKGFRNDQVIHARVIWRKVEAPLVPVVVVSRQAGEVFAYVVAKNGDKNVVAQRLLKTSGIVGNNYVVQEGLKPGEQLIVSNTVMLADGMPIQPMPEDAQQQPQAGAPSQAGVR